MSKYGIDELIKNAVRHFNETSDDMDVLFEEGNHLEKLSGEGIDHVKESVIATLETALNEALINSRQLLTEKSVVSNLRKHGNFNEGTLKNLSERIENLQLEYQESYKEVVKLENMLNGYR